MHFIIHAPNSPYNYIGSLIFGEQFALRLGKQQQDLIPWLVDMKPHILIVKLFWDLLCSPLTLSYTTTLSNLSNSLKTLDDIL